MVISLTTMANLIVNSSAIKGDDVPENIPLFPVRENGEVVIIYPD